MAFLMESQQFANLVFKEAKGELTEFERKKDKRFIKFAEKATPISSIVSDESMTLHEKAIKIFEKYVRWGSEYEINISYFTRQEVTTKIQSDNFKKCTMAELFVIFASCEFTMIKLLQPSFLRLRHTDEYKALR